MRLLYKSLAIAMACCSFSQAAITLVAVSSGGTVSVNPTTVNLSKKSHAGNLLVVMMVGGDNTQDISTISDTAGDGFTKPANALGWTATGIVFSDIWYSTTAIGNATSVTITNSGSTNSQLAVVLEYSGASLVAPIVDVSSNCQGASSGANTTLSAKVTTTVSGDAIVSLVGVSNLVNGVNAPYTLESDDGGHGVADHIPAGTVSNEQATFTQSGTANTYGCSVVAFEPTASASTAVMPSMNLLGVGGQL